MGRSASTTVTEETTTVAYNAYNPCYYLHLSTQALLKCLGLDSNPTHPPSDDEEKTVVRPPVSPGKGAQTNALSSS